MLLRQIVCIDTDTARIYTYNVCIFSENID